MAKKLSQSKLLASKLIFAAINVLVEKGGEAPGKVVIDEVGQRVPLDDWAKAVYEKSGYTRWRSILHFFSIDLIKAGFLIKKQGVWYVTKEGEDALKLGEDGLFVTASQAYKQWREANPKGALEKDGKATDSDDGDVTSGSEQAQEATIQQMEQLAFDGLKQEVDRKNAYEMQDLVAALLRGMGYYTPFVAPKGKDGGVDVVAYQDPLGVKTPRVKVQVKHKETTATVQEVRELMGLLQKEGDVGMFFSSSGFTADAKQTARSSQAHVELIDLERFISLWQDFYLKLTDEDKDLLRLRPILFYEPIS